MSNYYYILILLFYWMILAIQFTNFLLKLNDYRWLDIYEFTANTLFFFFDSLLFFLALVVTSSGLVFILKGQYPSLNLAFMMYFFFIAVIFMFFWSATLIWFSNIKRSRVHKVNQKWSHNNMVWSHEFFHPILFFFLFWFPVIFYYLLPQMNGVFVSINSFYYDSLFKLFCSTFHLDPLNGWFIFIFILFLFVLAAFPLGFNVYIFFFLFIFFTSIGYLIFYWFLGVQDSITIGLINFDPVLTYYELHNILVNVLKETSPKLLGVSIQAIWFDSSLNPLICYFQEQNIYNPAMIKHITLLHIDYEMPLSSIPAIPETSVKNFFYRIFLIFFFAKFRGPWAKFLVFL